jgi:uncharacterized OsmC-like protein
LFLTAVAIAKKKRVASCLRVAVTRVEEHDSQNEVFETSKIHVDIVWNFELSSVIKLREPFLKTF